MGISTHQTSAVAERHPGGAALVLQGSHVVTVIHRVVTPLQPVSAPVLHREMSRHQLGIERQV